MLYVYIRLKICFDYIRLTICFYMFQTMASRDQSLYQDDSDYSDEGHSDYEDQPTEAESDISSDEHDDQGFDDDYDQYSDYIDIEEEPL